MNAQDCGEIEKPSELEIKGSEMISMSSLNLYNWVTYSLKHKRVSQIKGGSDQLITVCI